MEKRCGKCKCVKPLEDFYKASKERDGRQGRCKLCQNQDSAARAKANGYKHAKSVPREKMREYQRKWYANNKDVAMRWRVAHMDQWLDYCREKSKKESDELADKYVRNTIVNRTGMRPSQVPQHLVEAKRAYLMAMRALKEAS